MFERDKTISEPIIWTTTLFMIGFHVGAIAALFFFSWKGLALAMVLWWISGSLGIGMGYHPESRAVVPLEAAKTSGLLPTPHLVGLHFPSITPSVLHAAPLI
jgi:hypothetical protein